MVVLAAVGGILLISNIDGPSFGFRDNDGDRSAIIIRGDSDEIDAKIDKVVESVTERVDERVEERVRERIAGRDIDVDDAKLDAAIEELKEGNPAELLELLEKQ